MFMLQDWKVTGFGDTEVLLDARVVEERLDVFHVLVAERTVALTVAVLANVVQVLASLLSRTVKSAPAVKRGGCAGQTAVVLLHDSMSDLQVAACDSRV